MPAWPNRCARVVLLMMLVMPVLDHPVQAQAPGHVVINWTSPAYGFSISYRRDTFVYVSESSSDAGDILNLGSAAGGATIEAFPAGQSIDSCAAVALEKLAFATEQSTVLEPVANGTGSIVATDAGGDETTHRVDCVLAADESYLIRYTHSAETSQYGRYASAALAIRESYRPGSPAGLIEPSLHRMDPSIPPPADSNLVNHPTRFFAAEISFASLVETGSVIDGTRVFIPGIGPALSYEWLDHDAAVATPETIIEAGKAITGRFVFAVPQGTAKVTFCYQHRGNNDCTLLFTYDFTAPPSSAAIEADVPPRIDPGR